MPDLTLYEEDIDLIRDVLAGYKREVESRIAQDQSETFLRDLEDIDRIRDTLLDHLVQHLHPSRKKQMEAIGSNRES